jgi:hypothetical protein
MYLYAGFSASCNFIPITFHFISNIEIMEKGRQRRVNVCVLFCWPFYIFVPKATTEYTEGSILSE